MSVITDERMKELITKSDEIITFSFDRIFNYVHFENVSYVYSINEIANVLQLYLKYANSQELQQIQQLVEYVKNRIYWTRKFTYFERVTVGGEQHSKQWFIERNKRITASSVSTVLGNQTTNAYRKLLCEKFEPSIVKRFRGSPATIWGTMLEPVARMIYSIKNKVNVNEYGLIPHKDYDFIGASPDGITDTGVLLEIKCPYSRNITNKVPKKYYDQIQHQLETCDYQRCHYAEYVFKQIDEDFWWSTFKYDKQSIRGVVIVFTICHNYDYKEEYEYSNIFENEDDLNEYNLSIWIKDVIDKKYQQNENVDDVKIMNVKQKWWILETYNVKLVERSREWFEKALPKMKQFIEKVNYYKQFENPLEKFKEETGFEYGKKKEDMVPESCVL